MPTVFVLGATGYIGGAVLVGYKKAYPDYNYVALVRSESGTPKVEALGVRVIKGSNSDLNLIEEEASKADIVLNAADADDLELTKAVLRGIKRTTTGKRRPILIHTSGTGLVMEEPTGNLNPNQKVYNDNVYEDIQSIPDGSPHRLIDLEIFKADEEGYVSAYIIAPSTIYGTGDGPGNRISQQIPLLIREALAHKQAVHVGDGTNEWNNVEINDLVNLYLLVADLAITETVPAAKVESYHKFFFGSAATHSWGAVVKEIGKILNQKGIIPTAEPKSIPYEPRLSPVATTSRTIADRSFKIGWKPTGPSLFDTLPETIDQVVAAQK